MHNMFSASSDSMMRNWHLKADMCCRVESHSTSVSVPQLFAATVEGAKLQAAMASTPMLIHAGGWRAMLLLLLGMVNLWSTFSLAGPLDPLPWAVLELISAAHVAATVRAGLMTWQLNAAGVFVHRLHCCFVDAWWLRGLPRQRKSVVERQ
jgi:hypothetical protein